MENIFSLSRFGNLVNKHFREHLRTYLMSLIVFGAIILIFFMFILNTGNRTTITIEDQFVVCGVTLFLGIFIFAGNIFSDYNHSRSAFVTTMLPGSIFEKYLLYWLVSLIGFTLFALGTYHLSQTIIIEYVKTQGVEPIRFFVWNVTNTSPPSKWIFLVYALIHSVAFLGAISFRKKTVIVTALISFAIISAYIYLNHRTTIVALYGDSTPIPFVPVTVHLPTGYATLNAPNNELWAIIFISVLVILLWICAYFKLKERQV